MARNYLIAVCFLIALGPVFAHEGMQNVTAGQYTVSLRTDPDTLQPGQSELIVQIERFGEKISEQQVWLRLRAGSDVIFATQTQTDTHGEAHLTYTFLRPGNYYMEVTVQEQRAQFPVHVHGQFVLLFGFLAAMFIVAALLLDKM